MMTPIAETGTGYSDCTGIVSNVYSGSSGIDSLEECKAKCLGESTCNTINYCSIANIFYNNGRKDSLISIRF